MPWPILVVTIPALWKALSVVRRARFALLAGDGLTGEAIAAAAGKSLLTMRQWRRRYAAKGVDGMLKDATRPEGSSH